MRQLTAGCIVRVWPSQLCVEGGGQFSRWMRTRPALFSEAEASLVAAGELSGSLDIVLDQIATGLEEEHTLRQRMFLATFIGKYIILPLLWLVCGSHNIMKYGLNGLEKAGAGLSEHAQQKVILSEGLKGYFHDLLLQAVVIGGIFLVFHVAWHFFSRTTTGRHAGDQMQLLVPAVGRLWRDLALRRYFGALSLMTRAGVAPGTAAEACADISGNVVLNEKFRAAARRVRRDDVPVTQALSETGLISPMVLRLLRTGEYSGSSDLMLDQVVRFYDHDVQGRLITLPKIIGLMCLALCAAGTLFVVANFVSHYYNNVFNGVEQFMNMK
ncbi:MAG TPA: type II secretion system F family protein [Abditibacteriaceae bacterium]